MGHAEEKAAAAIARVEESPRDLGTIFVEFDPERILADAAVVDARHDTGETLPLRGLLVSLKDLVDEAGQRTTAGSRLLAERERATADAEIVRRLKAAGAVPFGRTSLSEFAYSGLGLNPHRGTPGNVFDETRVPGGSSSGAALGVALGWCDAAIGTDTGGSVRIPAALNGLVGIKPTQAAVPRDGVHALSDTFDSVGPLAPDLDTALRCHEALCGVAPGTFADAAVPEGPLRLAVPRGAFTDGLDASVATTFETTTRRLAAAGHTLVDVDMAPVGALAPAVRIIVASEAHALYSPHFARLEEVGDPNVLRRIRAAETFPADALERAHADHRRAVVDFADALAGCDALLAPTVAVEAPTIAAAEADFDAVNPAVLRNTTLINLVGGCAVTLPVAGGGPVPGALMVAAPAGADAALFAVARALARLVATAT